ncbi:MAG: hypothetical protein BWK80_07855 [Desulfobacteraceae bacterium IS3]|nr:MAG: hypothetical protein BWK80_07855 [Desulfobacteraceae bacterium IS3]
MRFFQKNANHVKIIICVKNIPVPKYRSCLFPCDFKSLCEFFISCVIYTVFMPAAFIKILISNTPSCMFLSRIYLSDFKIAEG